MSPVLNFAYKTATDKSATAAPLAKALTIFFIGSGCNNSVTIESKASLGFANFAGFSQG